jgi:phytanoyl-CoA hydroxylase
MVETERPSTIRQTFESDGFVIFPGVLSADELQALQQAGDEMIDIAERNPRDIFCNYYLAHRVDHGALYDLYQRHPVFRQITETEKILQAIQSVYADEFYLFENSLVYKPEGTQNEVPWHQDYMYMTNDPDKVIAWLAMDDITEENGCMYAIPGSHKSGTLDYRHVPGEAYSKRTDLRLVDESRACPLLMNAGDLLVFHQFVLHSSKRVSGTLKRRAYRFAVKTISNSYTPRATPIVLKAGPHGALLRPYPEYAANSFRSRLGRAIVRLGQRLQNLS